MTRVFRFTLASLLALSGSLACAGSQGAVRREPASPASSEAGADPELSPSGEAKPASVSPGINDRYFEEGAVEAWTKRLERERREVIAHRDEIVAALALREGMSVADVGAGTGAFMASLSEGVGDSGKVYAVDIAPAFLDHLRERAGAEGLGNVEVIEASETEVGLAEGSVDLLFLCDVYHHLEYPSPYLQSLARALRPGGKLVVVEFARIPGVTSERMMKHVRQDQATLEREVQAEGFVLEEEIEGLGLEENYVLVFRRP